MGKKKTKGEKNSKKSLMIELFLFPDFETIWINTKR